MTASCNDETPVTTSNDQNVSVENPHARYLQRKKTESGITNRTTYYTIANALIYANDGMNFLYCRPDDDYLETIIKADTCTISVLNGEIEEEDLIELMDEIAAFAGDIYYADGRGDKEPVLFDINLLSSTSTIATFQAIFHYAAGMPHVSTDNYPYEDSWIYGEYLSDVSEFCSTEGLDIDAADLLRRDLRSNLRYRNKLEAYYFTDPYYACYHILVCGATEIPFAYLFINFDEIYYTPQLLNQSDITEEDNLFDYLIFSNFSGYPNYNSCLSAKEMDFYYESMFDLADNILPSPPGNLVISNIEVGYESIVLELETEIAQTFIVVRSVKTVVTEDEHLNAIPLPN